MWTFFIKKFRVTYLVILAIVFLGMVSFGALPREADPEIKIPIAIVSTAYPGSNPVDTENLITKELEKEIAKLDDIDSVSSVSGFGVSSITVEFDAKANIDDSIRNLKDAVTKVQNSLPEDVLDPVVLEVSSTDFPIITFSVSGPYDEAQLKYYAEEIQDVLESVESVSDVNLIGVRDREVQVILDQDLLEERGLSLYSITEAIRSANINLPLGDVEIGNKNYNLRFEGDFESIDDIKNIPVYTDSSNPDFLNQILLGDIAQIKDDFSKKSTISKIGFPREDSEETISLQVYKQTGGNILQMVAQAKSQLSDLSALNLPEDINITITGDNSVYISEDFDRLSNSGVQTVFIIVIILFLALNFKESLVAGLAVPLSFLITFIIFDVMGMTLNSMTLFSLVLALGLMIDTAIVIIEGVHDGLNEGKTAYQSAIESIDNYKWPLISGTCTTLAAFFPMLLVSGIVGEYLKNIPITLSASLISSLFVSLIILPAIAARFLSAEDDGKRGILKSIFAFVAGCLASIRIAVNNLINRYFGFIYEKKYPVFLRSLLESKTKSRVFIAVFVALFFITLALPITGVLKVEMFPKVDVDYFNVSVELPAGTKLDQTVALIEELEEEIQLIPELDNYISNIGTSSSIGLSGSFGDVSSSNSNIASITVNLVSETERERSSLEVSDDLRSHIQKYDNYADIKIEQVNQGPPSAAPIEVRIQGPDLDQLQKIALDVKDYIASIEGTIETDLDINLDASEFVFSIDREKAAYYGFSAQEISSLLRTTIYGQDLSKIDIDDDELDVVVKFNEDDLSFDQILNTSFLNSAGQVVLVKNFINTNLDPVLSAINRLDEERIIRVRSNVEPDQNVFLISEQVQAYIDSYERDSAYVIQIGGEREDIDESFNELFRVMILAVVLIAMILVLQFNSFKQPLIIIFTIPLALIGVFPGLILIGLPLSFPAFLGVVALAGIVVNDAIVLIDKINKNRQSLSLDDSIMEAAKSRFQPIFLTSITTVFGILPLALSDEFWAGLGYSVVFGLTFSTILTLLIVPVLYHKLEGEKLESVKN